MRQRKSANRSQFNAVDPFSINWDKNRAYEAHLKNLAQMKSTFEHSPLKDGKTQNPHRQAKPQVLKFQKATKDPGTFSQDSHF